MAKIADCISAFPVAPKRTLIGQPGPVKMTERLLTGAAMLGCALLFVCHGIGTMAWHWSPAQRAWNT